MADLPSGIGLPLTITVSAPLSALPYAILPDMARVLAYRLATDRDLYATLGEWVKPDAVPDAEAQLVIAAVRAVGEDWGHGPGAILPVLQRLNRWVDQGTHTRTQALNAAGMLDQLEIQDGEGKVPSAADVAAELVPLLKTRARRDVLLEGAKLAIAQVDLSSIVPRIESIEAMGVTSTDIGDGEEGLFDVGATLASYSSTGIPEADAVTGGGYLRGTVSLIAADTGGAKSMMAVQAFAATVLSGGDALFATIENPLAEVKARFLAYVTGVPTNTIRSGSGLAMAQRIFQGIPRGGYRFQEWEDGGVSAADLQKWLRLYEAKTKRKVHTLVVDGVYHMIPTPGRSAYAQENSYNMGGRVMQGLVNLAKSDDVAIVATSHVKRSDMRPIKAPDGTLIPSKNDLADSQHRARKASLVLTMAIRKDDVTGIKYSYFAVAKARYNGDLDVIGPLETDLACARVAQPLMATSLAPQELPWG